MAGDHGLEHVQRMKRRGEWKPKHGRFRLAALVLVLSACTGPSEGPGGTPGDPTPGAVISGTVTAPPEYGVQGTTVRLCAEGLRCLEYEVGQSGATAAFAFEDLETGTYRLAAIKQLSETRFLAGCFGDVQGSFCVPREIAPPHRSADIALFLSEVPQPPGPPPSP